MNPRTEFRRIPEDFVNRYDGALQAWARNFRTQGPRCGIRLNGPVPGVIEIPGMEPPSIYVVLTAELQGGRMVVKPESDRDEEIIRKHVEMLRN